MRPSRSIVVACIGLGVACHDSAEQVRCPEPAAASPSPAPPIDKQPDLALQRSCEGDRLDLAWIGYTNVCAASSDPLIAAKPTIKLEPPSLTLAPGEVGEVHLVYANESLQRRVIEIPSCELAFVDLAIYEGEERVDLLRECAGGGGCGGPTYALTLAPGGTARLALPVEAQQREMNDACQEGDPRPLKAGTYRIEVSGPAVPVSSELVVD